MTDFEPIVVNWILSPIGIVVTMVVVIVAVAISIAYIISLKR